MNTNYLIKYFYFILFILLVGCKNANLKDMPGTPAKPNGTPTETFNITINKNSNEGSITDLSLNLLNCGLACTTITKSVNSNSNITLQFTANTGYTITGWTGCDSVSNSNTTCSINNIQSNKTISPIILQQLTRSCAITNGVGQETSSDNGSTWSTCTLVSCDSNFHSNGNACDADIITYQPVYSSYGSCSASQACDGVGSQSRTITDCSKYINGSLDSSVALSNCSSFNNSTYLDQVCNSPAGNKVIAVSNGSQTVSCPSGSSTQSFVSLACNTNYTNVSNSCVLTSQTRACTITNGSGQEVSSDGGVTWGSCTLVSCDSNYHQNGNACDADVITYQPTYSAYGSCSASQACDGVGSQSRTITDCSKYINGSLDSSVALSNCSSFNNSTYLDQVCNSPAGNKVIAVSNGSQTVSCPSGSTTQSFVSLACDSSYTNVSNSCVLTTQTRACVSQPSHSSGGLETSNDGGVTYGSCSGYSCDAHYTNIAGTCTLDTFTVNVTKLISTGAVSESSFGKISCASNCSSETQSYDYSSMIVFTVTPDSGYAVTGWTGCDAVSGDNSTCTISAIAANRTITPVLEATYQTLAIDYSNANFSSIASYSVTKNGSNCTGACLSTLIISDAIVVSITPSSFLNNVSSFSKVGTIANENTATTNQISFNMSSDNVTITANMTDKDIVISDHDFTYVSLTSVNNDISYLGGTESSLAHYVWFTASTTFRFVFYVIDSRMTNDRSVVVYSDNTCATQVSEVSTVGLNYANFDFTNTTDGANTYYYKVKNVTKTSSCYKFTAYHKSAITKTTETFVANSSIESSSGYNSFLADSSNTLSGSCVSGSSLGNPGQFTYNYGLQESRSDGITVVAKAFMNADLVNPIYTQSQNSNCSGSSTYSLTFSQNANFVTADVIKYYVTLKNYFNASYTEVITLNKEYSSKSCAITNGTGSQSYLSNGSYDTCTVTSCNTNYMQSGNTCVLTVQTRACVSQPLNTTGGLETSNNGGATWGACSGFSCDSGYTQVGQLCFENDLPRFSTGTSQSCAISNTNQTYCWGSSTYGEGGRIVSTDASTPTLIDTSGVLSGKILKTIDAGYDATCAISTEGKAYCWGLNDHGQLGDNSTTNRFSPVAVYDSGHLSGKVLKQISVGRDHTCATSSDGNAYCWGYNFRGQVSSTLVDELVPVPINKTGVLSGKFIKNIYAGQYFSCVLTLDNLVACWGSGGYGELGNGASSTSYVPVLIDTSIDLSGKTVKKLSAKITSSPCVIASDDKAYCWGYGQDGELGDGTNTTKNRPTAVYTGGVLSGKNIKAIAVGYDTPCALTTDNLLSCWGSNWYGQIGNGTTTQSLEPLLTTMTGVLNGKTITNLEQGHSHVCVTDSSYDMYCWGRGVSGQLGDSNSSASSLPVKVTGGFKFY